MEQFMFNKIWVKVMLKKMISSYRSAWKLTVSSRYQLIVLLITITVFKIEVPLVIPCIIRWIFEAIEQNNLMQLLSASGKGILIFSFNLILMYFINVYGDAWAMKLAFSAAKNSYIEMSESPVGNIKNKYSNGDIFNRIVAGTGQIVSLWFGTIDIFSSFVAVIIITFLFAQQSGLVLVIVMALIVTDAIRSILMYLYVKQKNLIIEEKRTDRIEYMKSLVSSHIFHIMNDTQEYIFDQYKYARDMYLKENEKKINFVAVCDSISEVVRGIFIILLGRVYFHLKGNRLISMGEINSSYNLFSSLKDTANTFVQSIIGFSGKIIPIERLNILLQSGETNNKISEKENSDLFSMRSYSYNIDQKEILKNISLQINDGDKIAIIGDNGSGKSTLIKCILGLLNQEGSRIKSDVISYLPAQLYLFNSQTALRNICMGKMLAESEAEILLLNLNVTNALKLLSQNCGEMSGGEKQRVALVRSFISKRDLLIWDEPTSALDEHAISNVVDFIENYNKTIIFVTHLPELLKTASRILIMNNGKMDACITHEELADNEYYLEWLNQRKVETK